MPDGPRTRAAQAQCSPGARTLVKPGDRVWPELGNGGYQSIHSDVFINYDAVTNKFLPGTHVELMQKSTQCLSEFSLDFDRKSSISSTAAVPGSDMTVPPWDWWGWAPLVGAGLAAG